MPFEGTVPRFLPQGDGRGGERLMVGISWISTFVDRDCAEKGGQGLLIFEKDKKRAGVSQLLVEKTSGGGELEGTADDAPKELCTSPNSNFSAAGIEIADLSRFPSFITPSATRGLLKPRFLFTGTCGAPTRNETSGTIVLCVENCPGIDPTA